MRVIYDNLVTSHDPTELYEDHEKKTKKTISLFERYCGPTTIKGGIEIYDKNLNPEYQPKRTRGSKGIASVDDKFMEPGFRPTKSVSGSVKTDAQEHQPLGIEDIKPIVQDTVADVSTVLPELVSIKPTSLPAPDYISSGDFLESDRSARPLQQSKIDFSKISLADPLKISNYVDGKIHKSKSSISSGYKFKPK